jgi:hypothetical protein
MTTETSPTVTLTPEIERALVSGDVSGLTAEQRAQLYRETCQSLGLNPLTMPFAYVMLSGKLRFYALRGATDQLRALHKISIEIVNMRIDGDLFTVHVRAKTPDGRVDEDVGFAVVGNLKGEARGNATLKSITKAKRRVTLSICGLGMLDESEVASIPGAQTYPVETAPTAGVGGEPVQSNGHTASPAAPYGAQRGAVHEASATGTSGEPRPTADDIEALIALAEAANEPKELMATTLRRIMGLGGDVRITKKYLRERMSMLVYEMARLHYEQLLKAQVEDDVPDHPPADQVA